MNNNFAFGAKRDRKDRRDFRIAGITQPVSLEKQVFEIEEQFPPNNQFSRGSCTSQAQAHHKERQENSEGSARFIMALTKELEGNTSYGGYTRNSFKIVNNVGICNQTVMPEPGPEMTWEEYIDVKYIPEIAYSDAAKHKSDSYWRVENTIDDIRQTLTTHKNSIVMSMNWYSVFNRPGAEGRLPLDDWGNSAGGHAIEIKGFDDFKEDVLCKNSWGIGWGDKGYFKIPYKIFNKVVWDLWCSLDLKKELAVDNYYGQKRTWTSFLRERSFAFNVWLYGKIGRLPNNREIKGLAYGFWSFDSIFCGKVNSLWLEMTKPEAIKVGRIDKNENLLDNYNIINTK